MTIKDKVFIEMLFDYYTQNTDFDLDDELYYSEIIADLAEKVAGFINVLTEIADNTTYVLTDEGRKYLDEKLRAEKISRHDDLMEKYYNFTIDFEEYAELQRLKEELDGV